MKAIVELNIYSGIPNPKWGLTKKECTELLKRLDSLPDSKKVITDAGLGYSGFSLTIISGSLKKEIKHVRVYKGTIYIDNAGIKKNYQDLHYLEKWLIALADKKGYRNILKNIK